MDAHAASFFVVFAVLCYNFCMNEDRYVHLNKWLKQKFGERVLKICVDGGFTCPNRDGKCGYGGCIFCGENGSGNLRSLSSISQQVRAHLESYRGERAEKFIVYFQSFTNTYDTITNLKKKYDEAVFSSDKIVGLSVATRPDCVTSEVAKLLHSYCDRFYVQVELGLQTANDQTAELINRGYKTAQFARAVETLTDYGIDVVAHIMVGLPNETADDVRKTVEFLNTQKITGVKIHSTYVTRGTRLCEMFERGEYEPLTLEEYIESVVDILTHLRGDIVIHRISGDAPKSDLVAPKWNAHKKLVLNGVDKIMREKNLFQGQFFERK